MKKYFTYRPLTALFLAVFMFIISSVSLAKSINLYEALNANSKIIGTIDSNVGIIPIFAPKEKGWLKVADPRNGNVGWVKSADLNHAKINFTLICTTDGENGCQISHYTSTQSPEQVRRMMEKIRLQQHTVQKEINQLMQAGLKTFHQVWEE